MLCVVQYYSNCLLLLLLLLLFICRELKVTRARYVTLVSNHTSQADEVKEAALNYLSLLAGTVIRV